MMTLVVIIGGDLTAAIRDRGVALIFGIGHSSQRDIEVRDLSIIKLLHKRGVCYLRFGGVLQLNTKINDTSQQEFRVKIKM